MRKEAFHMDIGTFCEEVAGCIKEALGDEAEIKVHKIYKNNDVCLHSIVISYGNQKCVPNIYVDEYYQKYKMGLMSLGQAACEVMKERDILGLHTIEPPGELVWKKVKDKVFCRLVNLGMNQKKLMDMPYMEYLDFAVTCRWLHSADEKGIASADITYKDLELLGITKEELFKQAEENTEKLFPVKFQSLVSTIKAMVGEKFSLKETGIKNMEADEIDMYVLTNSPGINGAGVILYPNVLKETAEQLDTDTLYLLPSSVHEFMVLKECKDVGYMKELVAEANHCVVAGMDVLSDNVYRYDRRTDRVEIAE